MALGGGGEIGEPCRPGAAIAGRDLERVRVARAAQGLIPEHRLTFASNKVYNTRRIDVPETGGNLGELCSQLATVNCSLWHTQEKIYEFESVPAEEKDAVIGSLRN